MSYKVFLKKIFVMVIAYSVRFESSGEDLASGPGTRLGHSRAFVWQSFTKVSKGAEKASDMDIRRGAENAPLISLSKSYILFQLIITVNQKNVSRL